jgi:hypothetical protein
MQYLAADVTYLGAILVDHLFAARNPEDTLRASDKQGGTAACVVQAGFQVG